MNVELIEQYLGDKYGSLSLTKKRDTYILDDLFVYDISLKGLRWYVDVESDLQGITRPNTKCNSKQYKPECALGGATRCPDWPSGISYTNKADDEKRFIATRPTHLQTCQMNSYQGVAYPTTFTQETGTSYRF